MKVNDFLVESNESIMHRKGAELIVLVEGIATDMQAISNATVTKPFAKFKSEQLKVFVTKLKAWAVATLHELRPSMSFHNPEKHYLETLNKIINNPQETAEQIFSAVISRQLNNGVGGSSKQNHISPKEDKKIDDILGSITF